MSGATTAWAGVTTAGLRALSLGRAAEAAHIWERALDGLGRSEPLPGDDAVAAAALSNAGVGALLLGRRDEAAARLEWAGQAWERALDGVEALDVPVAGGSSVFHARLASRHFAAFEAVRRRRYRELIEAARAITSFNRMLASWPSVAGRALQDRAAALGAFLADRLGAGATEVRLLAAVVDDGAAPIAGAPIRLYADKADEWAQRAPSLAGRLSAACRRVETATALTVLVVGGAMPGVGAAVSAPEDAAGSRPGALMRNP